MLQIIMNLFNQKKSHKWRTDGQKGNSDLIRILLFSFRNGTEKMPFLFTGLEMIMITTNVVNHVFKVEVDILEME